VTRSILPSPGAKSYNEFYKKWVKVEPENRVCPNCKIPLRSSFRGCYELVTRKTSWYKGSYDTEWQHAGFYPFYFCMQCDYEDSSSIPKSEDI